MSFIKTHLTLLLGLSIPIGMILLIAGSIYIPGLFAHPHTNFLYVLGDDPFTCEKYSVQNNKLSINTNLATTCTSNTPRLFIYDTEEKKTTKSAPMWARRLPSITHPNLPTDLQ